MLSSARLGLLAAVLTTASTAAAIPALVAPADATAGASVSVHGRLLVVQPDTPGGGTTYGVAMADGDIVAVRGRFGPEARTGDRFTGRLAVPAGVVGTLARSGESGSTAAL